MDRRDRSKQEKSDQPAGEKFTLSLASMGKLFPTSRYEVDVSFHYLEQWIADGLSYGEGRSLNLEPDYQRGHVWSRDQQREYVEYVLQGGEAARNIYFAADREDYLNASWNLVDGLQRMTAVREFLALKFGVFADEAHPDGHYANAISDLRRLHYSFRIKVIVLKSRADELRLYLSINTKGTPHASEEIARVRALLEAEEKKS